MITNFVSGRAGMMFLGNLEDASTRLSKLKPLILMLQLMYSRF